MLSVVLTPRASNSAWNFVTVPRPKLTLKSTQAAAHNHLHSRYGAFWDFVPSPVFVVLAHCRCLALNCWHAALNIFGDRHPSPVRAQTFLPGSATDKTCSFLTGRMVYARRQRRVAYN